MRLVLSMQIKFKFSEKRSDLQHSFGFLFCIDKTERFSELLPAHLVLNLQYTDVMSINCGISEQTDL